MIPYIQKYFIALIELLNEMSPYLLLGFLFAGILYIYFPGDKIYKWLGRNNFTSVIRSALIGVPLPLCSCGVIPTGLSFYKSGASKGSSVSFLISTPQTGIDSIMVTYSLLGLPLAIIRPVIAFITGIFGGVLVNVFGNHRKDIQMNAPVINGNVKTNKSFIEMFRYAFIEFLQDISKWLVIGLLIAALLSILIPNDFFVTSVNNRILNMFIVLVASVPIYVCATGSVPIAAVLMLKGISPGAALVFLMAGPATNAATITVISQMLGKRTLLIYLFSIIAGALFFGFLIDSLFALDFFSAKIIDFKEMHVHTILPVWLKYASSILLVLLIINGYLQKLIKNRKLMRTNEKGNNNTIEVKRIKIDGMTCNHCVMNVRNALGNINGIRSVEVSLKQSMAVIKGDRIDIDIVKRKVEDTGYKFKGEIN